MRPPSILPVFLTLAAICLSACSSLRDGVIVAKRARAAMPELYQWEGAFRYEPSVYWVRVEGRDAKGRSAHRDIILFRHDWEALRVGDHWSKQRGFSPAEAGGK